MEVPADSNSLRSAQSYWNAAAETFAKKFSGTTVGHARRQAVWHDLERAFKPGQHILELNCGTGIDAVFLARKGIRVLACDIAPPNSKAADLGEHFNTALAGGVTGKIGEGNFVANRSDIYDGAQAAFLRLF